MKRIILFLMLLTTFPVYTQEITGEWNGVLNANGTQLPLVFNIEKKGNDYITTLDSPDQGANGITVDTTTFEGKILKMKVNKLQIEYTAELNNQNKFIGTFEQSGQSFPLNLSREKVEKLTLVRPQEPKEPYPYYSEDVKFENTKDKITLAGTLTLPKNEGVYPVVILITGSGPQNRNEEVAGHKPFLVIADHLTRNGIGVFRYDDRGTYESGGDFKTATSGDFAADAKSAIEYLKTRSDINKIGLIGHSEGGLIAPMVASESQDISFIVLLAGPGIRGDSILILQSYLIRKASDVSDKDNRMLSDLNRGMYDILLKSTDNAKLKYDLTDYINQSLKNNPDLKKSSGLDDEAILNQINTLSTPWFQYFIKYDPAIALRSVKCPVLALNGSKDLQVPPLENLESIRKHLEEGGNKNVTIKELPDLNHLFQESKTGSPSEYSIIEQTISPVALNTMTEWILLQVDH